MTRQHSGDDVGDVKEGRTEKYLFDALVCAFHDDQPNDHGTNGNADVAMNAKQLQASSDAEEFGDHIAEIDDHERKHHEEGRANAKLFADKVAESLACGRAHARAHLLDHDQGDRDGQHGPEQRIPELRARLRVGEDAAGVVVHVGRDEAWADGGHEQQHLHPPARQYSLRLHLSSAHIMSGFTSRMRSTPAETGSWLKSAGKKKNLGIRGG
jgi:hypothetical protein